VTTDPSMRLVPCLAERWDNPDPTTWVFHLRQSARFHSGKPLTAADVVFSIDRVRTNPALELSTYAADVAEARAIGSSTVWVRTREPVILLLSKLQYVSVVPKGSSPETLRVAEDGSGPYVLERWEKGSTLRMTAFPAYWGGRPPLTRVAFRLGRSAEESSADFASGRSQLVQCGSGKIAEDLPAASRATVKRRHSLFVKYLAFDVEHEVTPFCPVRPNPFRRALVREAIDLAIDRARLTDGPPSETRIASQLVPPFIFGFNPALAPSPHRPERARRLLAEAGLPAGLRATLHCRDIMAETALRVKRMLADVGVFVTVQVVPDDEFARIRSKHGVSLYIDRYGCETGDASEAFDDLIHTPEAGRRLGQANSGGYSNRDLDAAIERSAVELDVRARSEDLKHIMAVVHDERPIIPLDIEEDAYAIRPDYLWEPRDDSDIRAMEIRAAPPRR
jgi:peptide/nickel transport system substrate-binding protein